MNSAHNRSGHTRRDFLKGSLLAAGGFAGGGLSTATASAAEERKASYVQQPEEWRNKQAGMVYRRLGRTGFMISELVIGGSSPESNFPGKGHFFEEAFERGINYVDTASRYNNGQSEEGWGELFRMHPGLRDRVFVATKLSQYGGFVRNLCREVFQGLPAQKQEKLRKQAADWAAEREVLKPGYFYKFWEGHGNEIADAYLMQVVKQEYGFQRIWKSTIEKEMRLILEGCLQRLNTDVVDILHFPHGCCMPEELEDEIHLELTERFKREGKIRATGFSSHTDQPRVLSRAAELGHIDMAMVAYNIANQGAMEPAINQAVKNGMGIVAMKGAMIVNPLGRKIKVPQWRIDKLNTAIPEELPLPVKAYTWVLQNPKISAVISEINNSAMLRENLAVVGKRVEVQEV